MSMCKEVTDPSDCTERELLSCMTNELYHQKYSVITEYFPVMSTVGRRLVDAELLKMEEYDELCGLLGDYHRPKSAGTTLVKYLLKRGHDSMRRFYTVLLDFKDRDTDVDTILEHLEEAAEVSYRCRKMSFLSHDRDTEPFEEEAGNNQLQWGKKTSIQSYASSGFNSSLSSSSMAILGQQQLSSCSQNLRSDVRQMKSEIGKLREDMTQLRGEVSQLAADMQRVLDNTLRILHTVGTSSGRPSIVSTSSSYTTCTSGHSTSHSTDGSTSVQPECPSSKGRAQSVPDVTKQMQLQEPVWQPPVGKHQQTETSTTLQTVPEETAPSTTEVPHYSINAGGDTHEKEGIGLGHLVRLGSSTATNDSEDSQPSLEQKKTPRKTLKSFFRRKAHGL